MDISSKYKYKKTQESKKKKISYVPLKQKTPQDILLKTPLFRILQEKECKEFDYPINKILQKDIIISDDNIKKIFICIFRINTCNNNYNVTTPFLEYLLFKYSSSQKKMSDSLIFPFVKNKNKNTLLSQSNKLFYTITGQNIEPVGFLEKGKDIYYFYNMSAIKTYKINKIKYLYKKNQLWWTLIDEICNHRKLLNFNIHKMVYSIFYNNPVLIYLKDEKNIQIEVPVVAYVGDYYEILPAVALSVDPQKTLSHNYNFGSFLYAVKEGGWSKDFNVRVIDEKQITDAKGKYTQGGLVRFTIFMNHTKVLTDKLDENLEDILWKQGYDSLFIGKNKSDNTHYIIKNFNQKIPLSIHLLDMKSLKKWDPRYQHYEIE